MRRNISISKRITQLRRELKRLCLQQRQTMVRADGRTVAALKRKYALTPQTRVEDAPFHNSIINILLPVGHVQWMSHRRLETLADVASCTADELLKRSGLGRVGLNRIVDVLAAADLRLDTFVGGTWPIVAVQMYESLDSAEFSAVTLKLLTMEGILTWGDLVQRTESQLLGIHGFGRRKLRETKELLAEHRLWFDMKPPNAVTA